MTEIAADWTEIFSAALEFEVIFGIAAIGWLIGVACIVYKADRTKDRWWVCVTSDIVNKTFVSITFVAAVAIAINVSVYLPRIFGQAEPLESASAALIRQNTDLLERNEQLSNQLRVIEVSLETQRNAIDALSAPASPETLAARILQIPFDEGFYRTASAAIIELRIEVRRRGDRLTSCVEG
jgi:hypothetical protein